MTFQDMDLLMVTHGNKACQAADFLKRIVSTAPFPLTSVRIDNGSEFKKEFITACKKLGIKIIRNPVRHPTSNGKVERLHRTIEEECFWRMRLKPDDLELARFWLSRYLAWYNTKRKHVGYGMEGRTPQERIEDWIINRNTQILYKEDVNETLILYKQSKLWDLWNNEKFKYFRKIIKNEKITPACYRCCNLKLVLGNSMFIPSGTNLFILITHAAFTKEKEDIHGPAHSVDSFLHGKKLEHIFLRHAIYGGFNSLLENDTQKMVTIGGKNIPLGFRPFWEILVNLKLCFDYRNKRPIFIGVDPLNAFCGVLAKSFGWVKRTVFYTPDYTEKRFANKLLNYLYHGIDKFTARNSDQVWCVSKAIVKIRRQQKVEPAKIFYVPNTPSLRLIGKVSPQRHNHLVIVGNVNKTIDYPLVIESVKELTQKISDLKLLIAGGGDYMSELKELVKSKDLEKAVKFLGAMPHESVLRLLKTCRIGIALYTGEFGTNLYGDSMKIREYLACGLPVITTKVTETSQVVAYFKAGEIIAIERKSFIKAVEKILNNYSSYYKNALLVAKEFDFDKMISVPLKELGV